MPGFAFPRVGPLGLGSPPSSVLCSAKTADCPSRSPSLLARPPIPWPAPFGSCSVAGSPVGTAQNPSDAWTFVQPVAHPLRHLWRETVGSPKFPSCPCECMPRSQTPVVPQGLRHNAPKTAAFRDQQTVGFPPLAPQSGYPNDHNYAISGLNHAACTLAPSGFAHPIAGNARGLHY